MCFLYMEVFIVTDSPKPAYNRKAYARKYYQENSVQIAIKLNKVTDSELIEVYRSIPNKSQWFKECLKKYATEHSKQED